LGLTCLKCFVYGGGYIKAIGIPKKAEGGHFGEDFDKSLPRFNSNGSSGKEE
jgi:hypothetical protein